MGVSFTSIVWYVWFESVADNFLHRQSQLSVRLVKLIATLDRAEKKRTEITHIYTIERGKEEREREKKISPQIARRARSTIARKRFQQFSHSFIAFKPDQTEVVHVRIIK